jgi:hypothetical protein
MSICDQSVGDEAEEGSRQDKALKAASGCLPPANGISP